MFNPAKELIFCDDLSFNATDSVTCIEYIFNAEYLTFKATFSVKLFLESDAMPKYGSFNTHSGQ